MWLRAMSSRLSVSTLATTAIVGAFLVMIPPDHFVGKRPPERNLLLRIGKNALGALLVAVGIVLSLPGVPGQGLLTILVGILLCTNSAASFLGERWLRGRYHAV